VHFTVNQKVRVRRDAGIDNPSVQHGNDLTFLSTTMAQYRGYSTEIMSVHLTRSGEDTFECYKLKIDNGTFAWVEEWLEPDDDIGVQPNRMDFVINDIETGEDGRETYKTDGGHHGADSGESK